MCGFVGVFGPAARALREKLDAAADAIRHRGPDARGRYDAPDGACALGHCRLSILDLSEAANQPMRDGDAVLVYNGEIYNHEELRSEQANDAPFLTRSDTETLLRLWRRRGREGLASCVGMYAGALYRETEHALWLFRDPLGIKPLYYARLPDSTLIFASEIKGLLALCPDLPRIGARTALHTYLAFENYPPGVSLFEGLHLLPPGGAWQFELTPEGRVKDGDRFQVPLPRADPAEIPRDREALHREVRRRITQSVSRHLLSDVPVGLYLSGGIDSSVVAACAAESSPGMQAFTGYFRTGDDYYDERPLARAVAERWHFPLRELEIGPARLAEDLDPLMYALEEPRMGMGSFSQFVVAREAARERKVILAGHGGDELFGGYPMFKACRLLEAGLLSGEGLRLLCQARGKEWPWIVYQLLHKFRRGQVGFAPRLLPQAKEVPDGGLFEAETAHPLQALAAYYVAVYLPGLLMVEDKISMAHSLETRLPLWSQPLVPWALAFPPADRMPGGRLKGLW